MDVRYLDLGVHRGGRALLDGLDLVVGSGSVLGLVGPNGSGKSTALRCLYRALAPTTGAVLVDGREAAAGPARAHAQVVAALPQQGSVELDFTVQEVVATGRFAHGYAGGRLAGAHLAHVEAAIATHDLDDLRHRPLATLSGGERQRALLARAVAQDPRVLVLDEPTNHLDLGHQLGLLSRLRGDHQGGAARRTTLVALHDLNLAAATCDELVVLHRGRLVARGTPAAVLADDDLLRTVFGVTGHLVRHPTTGVPQLLWDLPRPVPEEVAQQPSRRAGSATPTQKEHA